MNVTDYSSDQRLVSLCYNRLKVYQPFGIIEAIFLKSQQVKFVKVRDLDTEQLDDHKKKRQLGTGGSQDLAKPFSDGGGELGGSPWQQKEGLSEKDMMGGDSWRGQIEVSSGFLLRICGKTPACFKMGH